VIDQVFPRLYKRRMTSVLDVSAETGMAAGARRVRAR
jgi:hypothetical protein